MYLESRFFRGFVFGMIAGGLFVCAVFALLLWLGTLPQFVTLPPHVTPY